MFVIPKDTFDRSIEPRPYLSTSNREYTEVIPCRRGFLAAHPQQRRCLTPARIPATASR
jgi:hypothetical protein